jgi:membrane protein
MKDVLRNVLWPPVRHFVFEDGFIVAGYIAFTAIFALFPFLIFLLALAGFIGQGEAASESIALGLEIMPDEVAAALQPAIDDIRSGATPGLLTLSALLTIWFASSGMESLRHALERAYDVEVPRHFVVNRLQSILLTVLTAAAVLSAMVAIVGGPFVQQAIAWLTQHDLVSPTTYLFARYTFGLLLLLGITMFLHIVLPPLDLGLRDVWPGAVVSVGAWALVATLYSVYLQNFAVYSVTYGSLGGIVLTLFFFYISALLFIFGAQLNGALRRWRRRYWAAAAAGHAPGHSSGLVEAAGLPEDHGHGYDAGIAAPHRLPSRDPE